MRVIAFCVLFLADSGTVAATTTARILYSDRIVKIDNALSEAKDLWVSQDDLKRIVNGFELKPQGACFDDVCIPVKQKGPDSLVLYREGKKWFNLTAFARLMGQTYIAEATEGVWSFGEIPVLRSGFLDSAIAPDFALPDRKGKTVRLSDFRGKKVLLLTWASW